MSIATSGDPWARSDSTAIKPFLFGSLSGFPRQLLSLDNDVLLGMGMYSTAGLWYKIKPYRLSTQAIVGWIQTNSKDRGISEWMKRHLFSNRHLWSSLNSRHAWRLTDAWGIDDLASSGWPLCWVECLDSKAPYISQEHMKTIIMLFNIKITS